MQDRKKFLTGKKPYSKPLCTSKPISEAASLLRKSRSDDQQTPRAGADRTPSETPILLIEGYEGDIDLAGRARRVRAHDFRQNPVLNGEQLIEIRLGEEHGVSPPTECLLLDLRRSGYGRRGPLEALGRKLDLNEAVPIFILVRSVEDFQGWGQIVPTDCWRVNGPLASEDLAAILELFLLLCTTLTKASLDEEPVFSKVHKGPPAN